MKYKYIIFNCFNFLLLSGCVTYLGSFKHVRLMPIGESVSSHYVNQAPVIVKYCYDEEDWHDVNPKLDSLNELVDVVRKSYPGIKIWKYVSLSFGTGYDIGSAKGIYERCWIYKGIPVEK